MVWRQSALVLTLLYRGGGLFTLALGAQTDPAAQPAAGAKQPQDTRRSQPRPDARYAHPSGQDSTPQPGQDRTSQRKAAPSRAARNSDRGAKTTTPVRAGAAPVKVYRGASGKKSAAGTACSSARLNQSGALDCGTGGAAATAGKIITK